MDQISFESVWNNIVKNQGNVFKTITKGLDFTYTTKGNNFLCSRTNWNITKKDFQKAYEMWPIHKVSQIQNIINGPSYVLAVLKDPRIALKNFLII